MPASASLVALCAAAAAAAARGAGFTPDLPPLLIYWSAQHADNAVVATAAGAASLDASYAFVHAGALLTTNGSACAGGAQPLILYSNASAAAGRTHHHFTSGSARGAAWAAANGFTPVGGPQGCVYPAALADDSFVALEQWVSAARGDRFLVGDEVSRADARGAGYVFDYIDSYTPAPWVVWPDAPHPGVPWPRSADLLDVELEWGRNAVPPDIGADTWYPSWSSDGKLYSSFTDGTVAGVTSHSYSGHTATTGFATFTVNNDARGRPDPFSMNMSNVSTFPEPADPYESRYPSLNFVLDGVWYYGTYALNNYVPGVNPGPDCGNWCVQCPFDGIRYSVDASATWTAPRAHMSNATDNLFGETCVNNTKVRFGAPHAVDFGQNNQHSPDGRLYIVGHGAESPASHQAWMQGDSVYMARTVAAPDPATINDAASWEFYGGGHGADAVWSGVLADARPLIVWMNNTGVVTMSYHPAIAKYILVVSTPSVSPSCVGNFDTYFLESDDLTGPWAYVSYMAAFGPEAYFVHFPGRFMGEAAYAATPANRAGAVVRTHAHAPLAARLPPPHASPADQAAFESAARAANLTEHLAPLDDFPDAAQRTLAAAAYYDLFLSYSADFASGVPNPPGSGYHWSLQSTRLGLSADFARRLAMRRGAAAAAPALATADVSEPVPMPAPAADGGRFVMPWMCLEDCGATAAQIAAQLAQLATPGVFTAAAFEDYDLGADGTVNKTGARSRVSGAVKAMGLGSHAMIVSWDLDPIRLVFANPQRFIDSVISKILDVEGSNVTAINLDWEPHGSAPPLGPVPTPADGAAYAAFLDVFAKAMHARGVQVSVDIATWTDFWDYRAIGATAVDWVCDMETYSASLSAFTKQVAFAAPLVPASKYVVGLETHPFNVSELASRFSYLKSMQINKVAIWDTPMPDAWMPYLAAV